MAATAVAATAAPEASCVADPVVADTVARPATDLRVVVAAALPSSVRVVAVVDADDTSRTDRGGIAHNCVLFILFAC